MAEITLNNLVTYIETFATNHKQIKSFFFGDIWEYVGEKNDLFTVFTCTLLGSNLSKGVEGTTFQFGVFDYVAKDKDNEVEVLSDTKRIAKDFISYLNSPIFEDLKIDITADLTDYSEKFNHQLSGWFFNVTIKQPFETDLCSIPMTSIPSYPNMNVVTVTDLNGTLLYYLNMGTTIAINNTMDTAENYTVTGLTQTILQTPVFIYGVFLNGQRLTVTTDYTVAGTTITFVNALAADLVTIVYSY